MNWIAWLALAICLGSLALPQVRAEKNNVIFALGAAVLVLLIGATTLGTANTGG